MGNVHANTEAVPFDFESAEALKTHLTHLTQVIEHQLPARYGADGTCGAAQLALEGFTGGYARVYRAKLASSFALLQEFKECFSRLRFIVGIPVPGMNKKAKITQILSWKFPLVLCLPILRILRSTHPAL